MTKFFRQFIDPPPVTGACDHVVGWTMGSVGLGGVEYSANLVRQSETRGLHASSLDEWFRHCPACGAALQLPPAEYER